jgi:hypothetical protein
MAWMSPLARLPYCGLTQILFRMDRVKFSSCDYQVKILVAVDSNASCFRSFSSGSSSPKVAEFSLILCLVNVIAQTYTSTYTISYVYGFPWENSFYKWFHRWKNSLLRLLRTCMCLRFPIAGSSSGPGNMLSCGIAKVYSSSLKLIP